ncbi:23S rRNA (pseudouridine(1915)-N(3))-methyltransferase RlmH [Candidatus Saccharibacteria bacterium]|nr:23S rRNA (pseudouridine(1915)-N(3))-methyltransferase RlmH [Candidatus Saccharibacteria bacterium]
MKLHIVTVGKPKLAYAKQGWTEYLKRLKRLHDVRVSQIADKRAYDANHILGVTAQTYRVALVINAQQMSSLALADFLNKRAQEGREVSFIIGGPDGLPNEVITACDAQWSMSALTFPHDLAMVVLLETLYRSSTINAGHPYHH